MVTHIYRESPQQLFRELVEAALTHQQVASSPDSTSYLVHLLSAFIRPEPLYASVGASPDQTVGEILCSAIAAQGVRKLALLKFTGDLSLFVTGFQSDSLERKLIDIDYYIGLGGYAYAAIAHSGDARVDGELYEELATNFKCFVDVLIEVSENCALTDDVNVLRLYGRWLHTGSARTAAALRRRGVLLAPGSRQLQ